MTVRKPVQLLTQQMSALTLAVLTGVLLAIVLLASACGGSSVPANKPASASATASTDPSSTEPGRTYSVTLNDSNRFQPASLTIPRGATVSWTNAGQTTHTVTGDPAKAINNTDAALPSGAQAWGSGSLAGGQSFSHTFDVPGIYKYFCVPHESIGMVATVTVTN
jgi:plastocyanin